MPTFNVYEAKTHLSKLIDVAASGEDVVIARNGKPVARITALQPRKQHFRLGLLKDEGGWIADDFDDPLPEDVLAGFEGRE